MTTPRSPLVPKDQAALAAHRFSRWMDRQGIKIPAVAQRLARVHQARLYEFITRHHITHENLSAIAGLMKRSVASLLAPEPPRKPMRRRRRLRHGVPIFLTAEHVAQVGSVVDRVHANTTSGKKPLSGLRSAAEKIGNLLVRYLACRFTSSSAFQRAAIRQQSPTPLPSIVQPQHLVFTVSQGPRRVARRRRLPVPAR